MMQGKRHRNLFLQDIQRDETSQELDKLKPIDFIAKTQSLKMGIDRINDHLNSFKNMMGTQDFPLDKIRSKKARELVIAVKNDRQGEINKIFRKDKQWAHFHDMTKRNLLHIAAIYSNSDTFNLLVEIGVDLNQKDICGRTPLDLLDKNDRWDIKRNLK
jgi:hypothetical protein